MGKQKLNQLEVMLIKYLIKHGYDDEFISVFIGKCGIKNIWKIRNKKRWTEVGTPTDSLGTKLLVNFIVNRLEIDLV